ncbi:hypothetical protein [Flavisphingomonas formosensis]|uniref:hypothetical protein n=1 Tax=Flavisphingomonas formosensis TaxID=861534 RepID=UPI0012F988DB|nr:hypothetical protein [Sphingomonas formosensis]
MDKLDSKNPTASGGEAQWRRPILTVVAIEDITLGKLGSNLDLDMETNYAPD